MDKDYGLEKRKYVTGGEALCIVVEYIIRLFPRHLLSDDSKKNAHSHAFLQKVEFPALGVNSDSHAPTLV